MYIIAETITIIFASSHYALPIFGILKKKTLNARLRGRVPKINLKQCTSKRVFTKKKKWANVL